MGIDNRYIFFCRSEQDSGPDQNQFGDFVTDSENVTCNNKSPNATSVISPETFTKASGQSPVNKDGWIGEHSVDGYGQEVAETKWNDAYGNRKSEIDKTMDDGILTGLPPPNFAGSPIKEIGYEDLPSLIKFKESTGKPREC